MRFFQLVATLVLLLVAAVGAAPSGAPTCSYICPYTDADSYIITVHYPSDGSLFCRYPQESGDTLHFCVYTQATGALSFVGGDAHCLPNASQNCVYTRRKRFNLVDYVNKRREPVPRGGLLAESMPEEMKRAIEDGSIA